MPDRFLLQVEENTRFGRVFSPGQFPLPDDDTAADMYTAASRILQGAGMEHYEVSSYALPNHRYATNGSLPARSGNARA